AAPLAPPGGCRSGLLGRGLVRAVRRRDPAAAEHRRAVRLHRQPGLAARGALAAREVADGADAAAGGGADRGPVAADLADAAHPGLALHRDGRVLLGLVLALQRRADADRPGRAARRPRRPTDGTGHGLVAPRRAAAGSARPD